eukprot:7694891-Lingulodinium_polyedra.AAC.1
MGHQHAPREHTSFRQEVVMDMSGQHLCLADAIASVCNDWSLDGVTNSARFSSGRRNVRGVGLAR